MVTVRQLMSTDVVTVSPELDLRDAIELLVARHLGGAPVVAGRRLVGVLSTTDLLDFAATVNPVPAEQPQGRELGEPDEPGEWDEGAGAETMGGAEGAENPGDFYHHLWADVGADALERFRQAGAAEWDLFAGHAVSEVMSPGRLWTISPDEPLRAAAHRMLGAGIHRLLVTEGETLVGIISTSDIVRAVADGMVGGESQHPHPPQGTGIPPSRIPGELRR